MVEHEAATAAEELEDGEGLTAERAKRQRAADARAFLGPETLVELAEKKQARAEERAWRERVRAEEAEARRRNEHNARLYSALSAATETAKAGSSPQEILARADQFLDWLKMRAQEKA
jgi:hypothetical protein